jgi:type III secretion protein J
MLTSRISSLGRKIIPILCVLIITGCKEQIIHNLEEVDANRMVTALHNAGVEVEKKIQPDGRWSIAVEEEVSMQALRLLEDKRILRAPSKSSVLKGSVIASREAQKFEYERGLSQEIENTLLSLDGVLEARVHLNLPTPDPLLGKIAGNANGTGSVLVVTNSELDLGTENIAQLVSGASGISADKISVLASKAKITPEYDIAAIVESPVSRNIWSANFYPLAALGLGIFILASFALSRRKFAKLQREFEVSRTGV